LSTTDDIREILEYLISATAEELTELLREIERRKGEKAEGK